MQRRRLGGIGAPGVLPARWVGGCIVDGPPETPPCACLAGLGFCPCPSEPSAHCLTFKAGGGGPPSWAPWLSLCQGHRAGWGFGLRCPWAWLPQDSWDSVQASHFKCGCVPLDQAPLQASLMHSSILASAHSWLEGGPSLSSTLRHLETAGKWCSEGIRRLAEAPCSLVSGRFPVEKVQVGWEPGDVGHPG